MTDLEWDGSIEELRLMTCDLMLMSYSFQRQNGMTAEQGVEHFKDGEKLEKAFQFSVALHGVQNGDI